MTAPPTYPDVSPKLWQQFLAAHTSPATPAYAEAEQWLRDGWAWQRVVAEWHVGADLLWAAEWMGIITKDEAVKLACTCVDRCARLAPDVIEMTGAIRKGDMTAAAFGACCIMGNAEGKEPELPKDGKEPIPVAEPVEIPGAAKARYAASLLPVDKAWLAMEHSVQAKVHEARGAWCEALRDAALEEAQKAVDNGEGVVDENGVIWINSESARQSRISIGDDGSIWHLGERVSDGGKKIVVSNSGIYVDDVCVKDFGNITVDEKKLPPVTKAVLKELEAAIPRVKAMEEKAHADIIRDYLRGAK